MKRIGRGGLFHLSCASDWKVGIGAAQEALKLERERKEFAVGVVLETLQSEQDVTKARLDYVNTIMELNKAQYRLKAAVGERSK